jgi:hypothetical protein
MLGFLHQLVGAALLFLSAISTALTPVRVALWHIPVEINQVNRMRR